MYHTVNQRFSVVWLLLILLTVSGCGTLIDRYDKVAYQNATSLKVDSLALMDKAHGAYSDNEQLVITLKLEVEKAYEYAKGRPKNEIVTRQWEVMKDPGRNLLGGFLARWKEKGSLSTTFITEAKNNVSLGFDQIIGLESGKIRAKDTE